MLIDNKKTREISWNDFELSGNKENLINQGWESFEPYGNKPNLIPNGWDSFEPYRSGENYVENWDFSSNDLLWNSVNSISKIDDNKLKITATGINETAARIENTFKLNDKNMIIRMKVRGNSPIQFKQFLNTNDVRKTHLIKGEKEWTIIEQEFNVIDLESDVLIRVYVEDGKENNWVEIDWIQITPVDDQHLVVEKTPLGKGLTRIQTWGGKDKIKLVFQQPGIEQNVVGSLYAHNIGENKLDIYANRGGASKVLSKNEKEYVTLNMLTSRPGNVGILIRTLNSNDNLDFIASDPQIVEGEKPNMAYSIQGLDNDLYRIRTWGGEHDMKLKSPNFGQLGETGTDMTISLYVENNSDSMIRFSNNLAIGGVPYPDGAEYMITVPRKYKGFAYLKGEKVDGTVELDIRSDGNIDMIVSQPEIIEGHDLNAMLFIEDLEDGRKHVQVHNVNENTKLVYTSGGVIKGEPYTLETEIENDGRIFNLSANMFDSVVEVQKGMNDIRKSGELQDKELKIEIGVD